MTSQAYYPHPRYTLIAAICGLLTVVFTWELTQRFTPATALFCLVATGIALWSGQAALSRVEAAEQGLSLLVPFGQTQRIAFRQLTSVTLDGRLTTALTLIYHPQQPDGLLDLDAIRTLHLPTLLDQEELFTQLQARMPV